MKHLFIALNVFVFTFIALPVFSADTQRLETPLRIAPELAERRIANRFCQSVVSSPGFLAKLEKIAARRSNGSWRKELVSPYPLYWTSFQKGWSGELNPYDQELLEGVIFAKFLRNHPYIQVSPLALERLSHIAFGRSPSVPQWQWPSPDFTSLEEREEILKKGLTQFKDRSSLGFVWMDYAEAVRSREMFNGSLLIPTNGSDISVPEIQYETVWLTPEVEKQYGHLGLYSDLQKDQVIRAFKDQGFSAQVLRGYHPPCWNYDVVKSLQKFMESFKPGLTDIQIMQSYTMAGPSRPTPRSIWDRGDPRGYSDAQRDRPQVFERSSWALKHESVARKSEIDQGEVSDDYLDGEVTQWVLDQIAQSKTGGSYGFAPDTYSKSTLLLLKPFLDWDGSEQGGKTLHEKFGWGDQPLKEQVECIFILTGVEKNEGGQYRHLRIYIYLKDLSVIRAVGRFKIP